MPQNTRRRGTYYRNKTKHWYEAEGYQVEVLERKVSRFIDGRVMSVTADIFASDLLAMSDREILFIQCKQSVGDASKAIKDFHRYEWPPFVKKVVVRWEPRAREPIVVEA